LFDRYEAGEQAVLVHVNFSDEDSKEDLSELELLVSSAGVNAAEVITTSRTAPLAKYFVGSGKVEEIAAAVRAHDANVVIFNHALSPSQERNLEAVCKCRVLDRTGLILDIFAQRARTHEGKLQVELAQLRHISTRLIRGWTHLERQKGGIGMRGPGETEIETDRRIVRDKIALLKAKIKTIDKQMAVQRGNRGKMVRVALVGYTNVGKSTLMNTISKSEVFAENKLFATLDTTVRKVVIQNLPFLLTDTVGFIRKLPTQLVESFKSTLDEVREADLLLHVVDISHPNFEEHIASVNKILGEIDSADKPTIMVFNKIDAYKAEPFDETDLTAERTTEHYSLAEWKRTWMNRVGEDNALFISALNKKNLEEFKKRVYNEVREIHVTRFPYNHFLYPDYDYENLGEEE